MLKIIKHMTWKEKIDYIWTYYKIHIISVLVVLLLIWNLLNIYIFNPAPKEYVTLSFMGNYIAQEQLDLLDQKLNEHILPADAGNVTCSSYSFYESDDPSLSMAMQQKFMAMTSIGGIDILIATKPEFDSLMTLEYFGTLEMALSPTELKQFAPYLILNANKVPIGIQIQSSDVLSDVDIPTKDYYIGLCVNSQKPNEAKDALRYILGLK